MRQASSALVKSSQANFGGSDWQREHWAERYDDSWSDSWEGFADRLPSVEELVAPLSEADDLESSALALDTVFDRLEELLAQC